MILTEIAKDQLKEVISIGAGNASTALSKLLNSKVTLTVPEIFIQEIENVPSKIGNKEEFGSGNVS